MTIEKRLFKRVPKNFILEYKELTLDENPQGYSGKLSNISACGIAFKTDRNFEQGTVLKLAIVIDRWQKHSREFIKFDQLSISKPFVAIGEVVRAEQQEDGKFLLGVSLVNVDETHRDALKSYIDSLTS